MGDRYIVSGNATNTASATLPVFTVMSAATVRPRLYDFVIGSDATPADQASTYRLQRCTTAGTAGSSLTPQLLDPGSPAALSTSGLAVFSVGPTLTANAFMLSFSVNQRATFRWVAAPGGEIVLPATAANGIACMPTVTTAAYNVVFSAYVEE